jgi:ubiquitin C-terminal hydrolase
MLHEIASLREQFRGNSQHDAHEFLAFLLDGLSEDVCLVETKPYVAQPDSDDRDDRELADIWWKNHLLREHSLITALFAGEFVLK